MDNPLFFVEKEREMQENVVNERLLFHLSTKKMWISNFHNLKRSVYFVSFVDNLNFLIGVFDFYAIKTIDLLKPNKAYEKNTFLLKKKVPFLTNETFIFYAITKF